MNIQKTLTICIFALVISIAFIPIINASMIKIGTTTLTTTSIDPDNNGIIFKDIVIPKTDALGSQEEPCGIIPGVVEVYAVADEEYRNRYPFWETKMRNNIEDGCSHFQKSFRVMNTGTWDSADDKNDAAQLLYELKAEVPRLLHDVVIGFTGQQLDDNIIGVAEILGRYTLCSGLLANYQMDNLVQHEVSHFFGAPDHKEGMLLYDADCVMSYKNSMNTNNWCFLCRLIIGIFRFMII